MLIQRAVFRHQQEICYSGHLDAGATVLHWRLGELDSILTVFHVSGTERRTVTGNRGAGAVGS